MNLHSNLGSFANSTPEQDFLIIQH